MKGVLECTWETGIFCLFECTKTQFGDYFGAKMLSKLTHYFASTYLLIIHTLDCKYILIPVWSQRQENNATLIRAKHNFF